MGLSGFCAGCGSPSPPCRSVPVVHRSVETPDLPPRRPGLGAPISGPLPPTVDDPAPLPVAPPAQVVVPDAPAPVATPDMPVVARVPELTAGRPDVDVSAAAPAVPLLGERLLSTSVAADAPVAGRGPVPAPGPASSRCATCR